MNRRDFLSRDKFSYRGWDAEWSVVIPHHMIAKAHRLVAWYRPEVPGITFVFAAGLSEPKSATTARRSERETSLCAWIDKFFATGELPPELAYRFDESDDE